MELCQSYKPRLKKNCLSTRRKMKVLSALNSASRKCLCEKDCEFERDGENVSEHGQLIMTFLKSEQCYVEYLKQLKKCLIHPSLEKDIESLNDIIGLTDEMLSTHNNLYNILISGKNDLSDALKQLSSCLDVYISYSILINLELSNFEKFAYLYSDSGMNIIELLHEPITHISRCKNLFQNLCKTVSEGMYCDIVKTIENASDKINNASSVRKNAVRILQIQRLLTKHQPKILSPGRIVLKEGILYKVKPSGSGLKERVFFLFNDILLCCKMLSNSSDWHKKDSLVFSALFPLSMCSVNFVLGSSSSKGALFKVTCGTVSYLLLSKVPGESQLWVQELHTAIRSCQKQSSNSKSKLDRRNICMKQKISPFLRKSYISSENVQESEECTKIETMNLSESQSKASTYGKCVKFLAFIKL